VRLENNDFQLINLIAIAYVSSLNDGKHG